MGERFLVILLLLLLPWEAAIAATGDLKKGSRGGKKKPHIILSVADDLGYWDMGWKNPLMHTPTLDGLVRDGIELERHYMYRFCSPSRTMYLAGLYPFKHGQQTDLNLNPVSTTKCALQKEIMLLPEVLRDAGYRTHMIGKWHLGHYSSKYLPTSRGFESFVGFYSGGTRQMNSDGTDNLKSRMFHVDKCTCNPDGDTFTMETNDWMTCATNKRRFCVWAKQLMNESLQDGIRVVNDDTINEYDYGEELLAEEAARVIKMHDPSDPLFLYTAWVAPHSPIQAPQRFIDMNERMAKKLNLRNCEHRLRLKHAGMITGLDIAHNIVIEALKAKDMWKDTLLIFLSDNGGHDSSFRKGSKSSCDSAGAGLIRSGRNYPLRGGKFTFWEGGIRTLGFVYSENADIIPKSRRGTVWDGLISGVDWPKTILGAAGVPAPSDFAVSSIDQWEEIKSGAKALRKHIPMQIFGEASRYVFLHYDAPTEKLYKYISGYPGYIRAWGYFHKNSEIVGSDPGDILNVPEELDGTNPAYDGTLIRNVNRYYHKCINSPCLFDLTNDPSEVENIWSEKVVAPVIDRLVTAMQPYLDEEVKFPGSDLCWPGDFDKQVGMRFEEYYNVHSITVSAACDAYVPSYREDGLEKIDVKLKNSCPLETKYYGPRSPTTYPTTFQPTINPTNAPSAGPTKGPTTRAPTKEPTTKGPTKNPTTPPPTQTSSPTTAQPTADLSNPSTSFEGGNSFKCYNANGRHSFASVTTFSTSSQCAEACLKNEACTAITFNENKLCVLYRFCHYLDGTSSSSFSYVRTSFGGYTFKDVLLRSTCANETPLAFHKGHRTPEQCKTLCDADARCNAFVLVTDQNKRGSKSSCVLYQSCDNINSNFPLGNVYMMDKKARPPVITTTPTKQPIATPDLNCRLSKNKCKKSNLCTWSRRTCSAKSSGNDNAPIIETTPLPTANPTTTPSMAPTMVPTTSPLDPLVCKLGSKGCKRSKICMWRQNQCIPKPPVNL